MKLSLQKKRSSCAAIFAVATISILGFAQQGEAAATVLISDDGATTTVAGRGSFDPTGLPLQTTVGPNPLFAGLLSIGTRLYTLGTDDLYVYSGVVVTPSPGWLQSASWAQLPSVGPVPVTGFYYFTSLAWVGYDGEFDAQFVGTVSALGLSIGESITFTNPNNNDTLTISVGRPVTPVDIDIKPGSPENTVNLGSKGITKVAILGSADFDATEVDPLSVELADATVRVKGNGQPQTTIQDTNGDGFLDLVLHIDTEGFALTDGDVSATLTGTTFGGEDIEGEDVVRVIP